MPSTVASSGVVPSPHGPAVESALAALNEFLAALNSHDVRRWAETLHYPHIRIHEGAVTVWGDAETYVREAEPELAQLLATGWVRSVWESVTVVQAAPAQVHAQVRFLRLDQHGRRLGVFDSIYVLTHRDGRWGVLARIGFDAGVTAVEAPGGD